MKLLSSLIQRFKKQTSPWDICIEQIQGLDDFKFTQYYSPRYVTERIPVMFDSIETYIKKMKAFIDASNNNTRIYLQNYNQEIRLVYLHDFLISEKGLSLNLRETFHLFQETAINFFTIMKNQTDGNNEYNQKNALHFTSSLRTIVEFLHTLQSEDSMI